MKETYLKKIIDFKVIKVACFETSITLFFADTVLNKNANIVIFNDFYYNKDCLSGLLEKKVISIVESLEDITFTLSDNSNLTINLKHEAWTNGPEALVCYIDDLIIVWN
jgi:hypothetical protein